MKRIRSFLLHLLAGLLMLAGFSWFGWTWITSTHEPLPLLMQGWPAPVLFVLGIFALRHAFEFPV